MTTFVKESIDEALEATGYRIEEMSSLIFSLIKGMIQQSISFQKINPLLSSKMNSPVIFFIFTNKNLDFLIYHNDSNYLHCVGTAEPWLRNKVKELSKTGWVDLEGKSYL
jgi:hypothetical protein